MPQLRHGAAKRINKNTPPNPQTKCQDTTQTRAEAPPFTQTQKGDISDLKARAEHLPQRAKRVNRRVVVPGAKSNVHCPTLQKKNGGIVMVSLSMGVLQCNPLANVSTVAGKPHPALSEQF